MAPILGRSRNFHVNCMEPRRLHPILGPYMNRLIGTRVEQYQIETLIGQGPTGTVYRARDLNLERLVAVKMMHRPPADQPAFQQHFIQIAQAASRLNHPSIVSIYNFGNRQEFLYVVMEFIPGLSLAATLKRADEQNQVIKLNETLSLTAQIADALAHAHRQGLVHGNLRPDNILLKAVNLPGRDGAPPLRAVLTDFGLGQPWEGGQWPVADAAGMVPYLSPEQRLGDDIDGRADIYSLGVLLYQMTTGNIPFTVKPATEVAAKYEREPLSALNSLRPGVPAIVNKIIKNALAKRADERCQDAEQMAHALRQAAAMLTEADALLFAPRGSVVSLVPFLHQAEQEQAAPAIFSRDELRSQRPVTALQPVKQRAQPEAPAPPPGEAYVAPQPEAVLPPLTQGNTWAKTDRLVIVRPGRAPRTVNLDRPQLRLGRSHDNDIVLSTADVSRHHAHLEQTETGWQVVDVRSSGGTYLNERRLTSGVAETWEPGQVLRIGPYLLHWQRPGEARREVTASPPATAAEPGTELHQVPVGAAQIYSRTGQFSLVVNPIVLKLAVGDQANVQVELFNQGMVTSDFRLNVVGLPPDLATVPQDSVRLAPGARASLPLRIQAPQNGRFQAGKHLYQLVVNTASSSPEMAIVSCQVIVEPSEHFSMGIWPARLTGGGVCRIFIRNEGNVKTSYSVTGRDPNEALNFAGERGRLQLAPGQATTMALTIAPRQRPLLGRSKLYPFEVNVRSSRGNEQVKRGQVDVQPAVPAWVLPVVEILLVLLFIGTVVFAFFNQNEYAGSILPAQTTALSGGETVVAIMPQQATQTIAAAVPGYDGGEGNNARDNGQEAAAGSAGDLPPGTDAGGSALSTVAATTDSALAAPAATTTIPTAVPTHAPVHTAAPTAIPPAGLPAPTSAPPGGMVQLPLVDDGSGWINEAGQVGFGPDHPVQAGDGANNEAIRGFLSFDLSVIPNGATVQSAQLILPATAPGLEIQGQPFNDLDCLLLEAVEFTLPLNATAYNALAFPITCENTPLERVDVLIDVEDAIFEGLGRLQIRFSFEAPADGDNAADLYILRTSPQVEIVYTVP